MKKETSSKRGRGVLDSYGETIVETLVSFGVPTEIVEKREGIHQYEYRLKLLKPTRMKALRSFEDDLRYALGTQNVHIIAPIPDHVLVGVIIEKKETPEPISWSTFLSTLPTQKFGPLEFPIGLGEYGEPVTLNLATSGGVLIGGTTGSGKSMFLHLIVQSLLHRFSPDMCRLMLVDTKRIEFSDYEGIPHLFAPVIHEAKKALIALKWCTREMERRFDILAAANVMHIAEYHTKFGTKKNHESLPYIVFIIDEVADLIHSYPEEFESTFVRLFQMCRAVGIHIIISTQRPSVNVITGLVKANIPTRIALSVASQYDSRTILDTVGAEKLRGKGDALVQTTDSPKSKRVQLFSIKESEIRKKSKELRELDGVERDMVNLYPHTSRTDYDEDNGDYDDLYEIAEEAVREAGKASTSFLQRRLRVGYSRAARLIDMLEEKGVISPGEGSGPRMVMK